MKKSAHFTRQFVPGLCLALAFAACGDEEGGTPTPDATTPPDTLELPDGCDYGVEPSADDTTAVQTLLIEAEAGSTICLLAGNYTFNSELSISTENITLKGIDDPQLNFAGQLTGANGIHATGNGFRIEGLTVLNPAGDGIRATEVSGVTFSDVRVIWEAGPASDNGGYGLYPVSSTDVTIENCTVSGASDSGIYVGQSSNILVMDNEAYFNVAGIEIENSTDSEVVGNYVHDNTGGILVFNLPGLPVQDGKRAKVHLNEVTNNNQENFAPDGNIVGLVPKGTGLMVLAADDNEFHDNIVKDNVSIGIVIVAYTSELGLEEPDDPNFDAYPEGNYTHDNTFENNGTAPADLAKIIQVAYGITGSLPPMIWDGCLDADKDYSDTSLTNCFKNNGDVEYANLNLCGSQSVSYDISEVTCEQPTLSSIE